MDKIKEQYGEDFVPPDFIKRKYSSMWNEDKNLLNFKVTKKSARKRDSVDQRNASCSLRRNLVC